MIGSENDMLFSKETIGHVSTVENVRHKYITKDMRRETSEKNQSNGLFQFVNLAMTNNIEKIKSRTHNRVDGSVRSSDGVYHIISNLRPSL